MEITIFELITKYGMNTVIIASVICVITGIIKKPIKMLAKKMKDSGKLTRYITFLPIILGFGITILYNYIISKQVVFDGSFFTLWLTSSSLGLTIYAFKEKFIPSKNKLLTEIEVKENQELIEKIKETILTNSEETITSEELVENKQEQPKQKIILRGNINHGQADAKEESL